MQFERLRFQLLALHPRSRLNPVPPRQIAIIRKKYAGIPEDYLKFLSIVGEGTIGDGRFKIYGGPIQPDEIYDADTAASLAGVVLVGDNFGGWCVGYDSENDWVFGGVDSSGKFGPISEETLASLLTSWYLGT